MHDMNLDTFNDHLDRYGADLDGWPAAAREAAETFLTTSSRAAAAHAAARDLTRGLQALPERAAPPQLAARIAARVSVERDVWSRLGDWFGYALWRPALAAALPLALGFVLGIANPVPPEADDVYLLETLGMLPFSGNFEELPDAK